MASQNDNVFNFAHQVIGQEVVRKASGSADQLRRELHRELTKFVDDFYREMLYGKDGLQKYSSIYDKVAPLSTDYSSRKPRGAGYYENSGDLIDELLDRNALEDLGKPSVRFAGGQRDGSAAVFIDRAGRAQYAAGSGRRGFARSSDLTGLAFSINIDLFPKVEGKDFHQVIRRMSSGFNTLKLSMGEFGNKKAQPARPLVRPFLKWYSTVGLKMKLLEKFNIKV